MSLGKIKYETYEKSNQEKNGLVIAFEPIANGKTRLSLATVHREYDRSGEPYTVNDMVDVPFDCSEVERLLDDGTKVNFMPANIANLRAQLG